MDNLLTLDELAAKLNCSIRTLKNNRRYKPDTVPPRMVLPGTGLLRWRERDVQAWLDAQKTNFCVSGRMA